MRLKNDIGATLRFIRKNSLRATVKRIIKVLRERNNKSYQQWLTAIQPTPGELKKQRLEKFSANPLISIVVPTYNTPVHYLRELVESIKQQTYANWELCIAEGCSTKTDMLDLLKKYQVEDSRIRVEYLSENKGISGNTNAALAMARGEYIALADHDDMLTPDALFEVVKAIDEQAADLIYTDEDKMDETTSYFYEPHFKPEFSPDKLRCCNYFCHLMVMAKALLEEVGPLDSQFDGSQDHDLALRLSEKAKKIVHIPRVLYHWRQFANSMSKQHLERCQKSGRAAVAAHMQRLGLDGTVEQDHGYRVRYKIAKKSRISIIILGKHNGQVLAACLQKIQQITTYPAVEIIVVKLAKNLPESGTSVGHIPVQYRDGNGEKGDYYNWNLGATQAAGDYLLFLDDDLDVLFPDWLEQLVMQAQRREVGVVGSKLYSENRNVLESTGYIIGRKNRAFLAYQGLNRYDVGYCGLERCDRNVSAVPVSLMMVRKAVFDEMHGFAEDFVAEYGDVDFCLRLLQQGYLHIYTPYAEAWRMVQHIQKQNAADEQAFLKKWPEEIVDRYYNPNLTQEIGDYSLNEALYKKRQMLEVEGE